MTERIAIVYPWGNLDTVPSLCNAAELLADEGYRVEILTRAEAAFVPPSFTHEAIEVMTTRVRQERKGIRRYVSSEWLYPFRVRERHRRNRYRCFIGVDPYGLLKARLFTRFIRVPLVYYSLELLLSGELKNAAQSRLKKHEIDLSRRAAFVVIQDDERARLLAEDNRLAPESMALVPNAPLGPARRRHSSYWHRQFGLSRDHRIVLHAGSLGGWTGIQEIVSSTGDWPEKWVLVVHTRSDTQSSGEVERLRRSAPPGKVFFSRKPVGRHEYDMLVDAADVGIAFYIPTPTSTYTQGNIQAVGLSSGKIAYYMHSGLPVVINEAPSISELVQREGGGIRVRGSKEIREAIVRIAQDYQTYSAQACTLFDTHFDFRRRFQDVARRIASLPPQWMGA